MYPESTTSSRDAAPPAGVAALSDAQRAFVDEWAHSYAYNRYRNYRLVSEAQAALVLANAVAEPGADITRLWHRDESTPVGLIRIADLPWDTVLYRRKMGRITHLCGDLGSETIKRLLDRTSFEHLAVRVDVSDLESQRMLTRAGFFPVDTILTYLHDPALGAPPEPEARRAARQYTFRKYEPGDRDAVLRLTARSYERYPGRYYADAWLREKSAERYLRWAEKYVDGEADTIWVSEWKGRVVGYLAFRYDRRLMKDVGLGCYGSGLGASRGGDYQKLCRHALMTTTDIDWQCAEFETQLDNYLVHRIYRDLKLDYVHAEHTYHLHRT